MVREYETLRSKRAGEKTYYRPIYLDLHPQTLDGVQENSQDTNCPSETACTKLGVLPEDTNMKDRPAREKSPKIKPEDRINPRDMPDAKLKAFQKQCLELVNSPIFKKALDCTTQKFREYMNCPDQGDLLLCLKYPEIFRSICICDTKLGGAPVRLKSKYFTLGPRGVQVGHCPFLNISNTEDQEHCVLSVRADSNGLARYVLEYTGTLFSQESGKPVYVMSSQMDISKIVHTLTDAAFVESLATKAPPLTRKEPTSNLAYLAKSQTRRARTTEADIDWVAIAADNPAPKSFAFSPPNLAINKDVFLDFNELIQDIKFFHRLCFTLSPAPGLGCYQINWLSMHLNSNRRDLDVGLEHNCPAALKDLGDLLSKSEPVSAFVDWGVKDKKMLMYCVPMLSGTDLCCWICYLVDACIPTFWR